MKTRDLAAVAACALTLAGTASPSFGYLGSFGPSDGYTLFVPSGGPANWVDVTYYNAGAYGPNAGGGVLNPIAPDSGNWRLLSQVGGFFPSTAARNAALGGVPPYPSTNPPGTIPAYMVGGHFPGRNNDGYNLAFRNDTPIGTGPAYYEYTLDQYDFGGNIPASITSGTVTTQFYFCPNPADLPNADGTPPADKFTMTLMDALGNIGMQWGYARDNEVTWRTNPNGSWNYTGIYANDTNWDGIRIDIDLTTDTFNFEYYVVNTNTWQNIVPSGSPLGMNMTNLTTIGWQLEDGVISGLGGKNYFDDFSFVIPTPSAAALFVLGGCCFARRRRS